MAKFKPPVIELDDMKMYFGLPYEVDLPSCQGKFMIYQPTIGEIVEFGESKFYNTLNIFTTNTTSCRLMLWDMGIDWTEYKDYHLFLLMFGQIDPDAAKLIFRDFDITKFQIMKKFAQNNEGEEEEILSLYNPDLDIEINEEAYYNISQYLRYCFNINPPRKMTDDPILKQWYIRKDRQEFENNKKKEESGKVKSSSMQAVISACVNHPGFKYNLQQLKDVGVCEFYDSVRRLPTYETSIAILRGIYGGFVNSKEVKPDAYNWMKDI